MTAPVNSIRLGPYTITLKYFKEHERDGGLWGTFSEAHQGIELSDNFPSREIEAETLIHEILHGIYFAMSIKPKDTEERTVKLMSVGLSMFLRDNPELVDWIRESLGDRRIS